jgi:hypothetical protein
MLTTSYGKRQQRVHKRCLKTHASILLFLRLLGLFAAGS